MESKQKSEHVALKAGIWYLVSNIVVKAISVITTPIFTRLMSTVEYGTVQTFTSWHTLLLPVFTLSLTYSIGRAKLDFPNRLDEYIGSMLALSGLSSLALVIISSIFLQPISFLFELSELETILLVVCLFFGVATLLFQSGYRFQYKYKQNIAIALYSALVTTLLSLVLVLAINGDKADLRIIGMTIPTVMLSLYFWGKTIRNKKLAVNLEYWKYGLRISLPLILHTICMHILSQSDRVFISKIWGKSDTAFYSLAYTYGMLLHLVSTAIHEAWLPWFHDTYYSKNFKEIREKVKPLIILGCYIGLFCVALAPEGIMIMGGTKYVHSVPCVLPIVLGVVCQFIYSQYVSIELHLKKTYYVSAGTIFAALFNILTNAIFIPRYGFVAAAYTTLGSYFLLMIIHYVITKNVLKSNLYDDLFMFGSLIVTGVIAVSLTFTYDNILIRYILLAVGLVSFFVYYRGYIKSWISKRKNSITNKKGE